MPPPATAGIPVAIWKGVRFIDLDSRRARLLLLGALVLLFAVIAAFMLAAPPSPAPPSGPARETSKPPFQSHDVALLPSA